MLPDEFTTRMKNLLPESGYEAFVHSYDDASLHALRLNPLKPLPAADFLDPQALLRRLFPDAAFSPVPWCREGFYYTPSDFFRPGRSPYHEAGLYYIQEPSAMAAAVCLDAQPGDIVLDLCAAPGGKSTQIASAMRQEGLLIANEIIPSRAKILSENIERMGTRNAVVTNASPQQLAEAWPLFFDRILVDAPCSGEGMFRKNPAAADEWSPETVRHCAARQAEILSFAAQLLKPGGRMVYSTCTFSPEENEGTLTCFLSAHPDFHMAAAPFSADAREAFGFSSGRPDLIPGAPEELSMALRLYPHRTGGEGHFLAVLQKEGTPAAQTPARKIKKSTGRRDSAADALLLDMMHEILPDFQSDCLNPDRISTFGDQVYYLPEYVPYLSGIRVLRPGLQLGTRKKNRFEPAHALALTLSPQNAAQTYDLTAEEAAGWIMGLSVSSSSGTGWTLMTVNGTGLGWGKSAGGMIKNHYPKGLRRQLLNHGASAAPAQYNPNM